jgi:hypothetical protein
VTAKLKKAPSQCRERKKGCSTLTQRLSFSTLIHTYTICIVDSEQELDCFVIVIVRQFTQSLRVFVKINFAIIVLKIKYQGAVHKRCPQFFGFFDPLPPIPSHSDYHLTTPPGKDSPIHPLPAVTFCHTFLHPLSPNCGRRLWTPPMQCMAIRIFSAINSKEKLKFNLVKNDESSIGEVFLKVK